jgi:hypothetical protein
MTSAGSSAPPIFTDTAKFNGSNWVTGSGLILIAADLHGVYGYLDGSIPNPTPNPANFPLPLTPTPTGTTASPRTPPTHAESLWESTTPTTTEWRVQNGWTKGLLIYNTTDPIGLGINIHSTSANTWKSYTDTYQVVSEIAILNAIQDLQGVKYSNN